MGWWTRGKGKNGSGRMLVTEGVQFGVGPSTRNFFVLILEGVYRIEKKQETVLDIP